MLFRTNCAEETEMIGEKLASALLKNKKRAFIAMRGEMGVGKTAFTRGFARALGISGVKSPTYTVVNEYRGEADLFHFDFYRIGDEDDLYSIGFDEYIEREGYCLGEWCERIPYAIPSDAIEVKISRSDKNENIRNIEINGIDL